MKRALIVLALVPKLLLIVKELDAVVDIPKVGPAKLDAVREMILAALPEASKVMDIVESIVATIVKLYKRVGLSRSTEPVAE